MGEILYLSRRNVEALGISMEEVVHTVEEALIEQAAARAEAPPKPSIHPRCNASISAMPAWLPKMGAAGIKWVSGFPENPQQGLPYISGLLILNDPETGVPICVMDCAWITAMRTGAATAIATKHLAAPDSRVVGIIGCGVQGRSNLEALKLVCGNLEEVKAYDVSELNLRKYVEEMEARHQIEVAAVSSPRKAVEDCDVIVTAGPILENPEPVIEDYWLKEGAFACPLDFDSYWKAKAILCMDKFYTDDKNQLEYYKGRGFIGATPVVFADLGEVVSGRKPGRESSEERIMSMNLGLALEDVATAHLVYQKAIGKGVGMKLPL